MRQNKTINTYSIYVFEVVIIFADIDQGVYLGDLFGS